MDNWLLPITILPGIGMLVMSTVALSNALTREINEIFQLETPGKKSREIARRKVAQLKLLSQALFGLYAGAISLALAALLAGIPGTPDFLSHEGQMLLLCLGIGALVVSLSLLILFAFRSVRIKQDQFRDQLK